MNAELADEPSSSDERELAAALAAECGLSTSNLQEIANTMRSGGLSFTDAALQLGYVTPKDIERAATRSRKPDTQGSLVESLVRRMSSSRALVVREGRTVQPGKHLILAHDPYNPHSERIRALRTELLLRCVPTGKATILAVLSCRPGEGRSRLAAELAIAFAQLGSRTLLIDADFRNPKQHEFFGCTNDEGLSQAIQTETSPILHKVEGLQHMALLTAGVVPHNPLELLSDGRFAKAMMRWRDSYDYIVIDTPPMATCADGLAVAAIAGRVLMVTRATRTSYKDARDTLRRLVNTQAQILGAVVNHF